jgi:hypothetical protein
MDYAEGPISVENWLSTDAMLLSLLVQECLAERGIVGVSGDHSPG